MSENTRQYAKKNETKRKNPFSFKPDKDFSESASSPFAQVLHLQRTIGNKAVTRLIQSGAIQAKIKVGPPNDIYEQEADRVADKVMRMSERSLAPAPASSPSTKRQEEIRTKPFIQKQPDEEEELKTKPLAEQITPLVQRQMDEEEDLQAKPMIQRQENEEKNEDVQTKALQRQIDSEEEEENAQTKLQRQEDKPEEEEEKQAQLKANLGGTPEVTPDIESDINSMKGSGQPLSESSRSFFEPRFGANFSQVRLHNDSHAANTAQAINAKAFTVGRDIIFNSGQCSPGTSAGKRLLAHELTHVVQQGGVQRSPIIPSSHSMKSNHIHRVPTPAPAVMGAAEWIGLGAAGYAIARDLVGVTVGSITYHFSRMDGVLLPGGGNDVANYRRENPGANIQSDLIEVAVWGGWPNTRKAGIKFGISYRYDGHAIGNISCNILDTYDWPLWGATVDINFTPLSLARGDVAAIRITINFNLERAFIGGEAGSVILQLDARGILSEAASGSGNSPYLRIS